jgi:hypothetical protein
MSNVLALPLVQVSIVTGNNEDWVESFKFVVDDGSNSVDTMPQLDIRNMQFEMEVRRLAADNQVLLCASTEDLKLSYGVVPNYGFLLLNIPLSEMQQHSAGDYVADMVAKDEVFTRKCMSISLTIVQGVTR